MTYIISFFSRFVKEMYDSDAAANDTELISKCIFAPGVRTFISERNS